MWGESAQRKIILMTSLLFDTHLTFDTHFLFKRHLTRKIWYLKTALRRLRAENPDDGKLAGAEKKRKSYSYVLGQGNRAWCRGKLVIQNHESRRDSIVSSGIMIQQLRFKPNLGPQKSHLNQNRHFIDDDDDGDWTFAKCQSWELTNHWWKVRVRKIK